MMRIDINHLYVALFLRGLVLGGHFLKLFDIWAGSWHSCDSIRHALGNVFPITYYWSREEPAV
jgi:hypothetical protein